MSSSEIPVAGADPSAPPRIGRPSGVEIHLDEVTKRYPGSQSNAVDAVTMTVPAGETVVLVGPSGCGKTTTMRMINRLIEPSGGKVLIDGKNAHRLKADTLRRQIGYAIQQAGLFPHMTVRQNVGLVPGLLGWKRARIAQRVEELLEIVGLEPSSFADRYPRQLSGGQQQRVGVARALAADPPVLLMDEPFGAVDPITRGNLQDELIALQHELGKTIVFVTHDFDEAVKLGDRIAVLGPRSSILQYDTPEAILANPADDTVAGFVGAGASLKQLTLLRVRQVRLLEVPTAAAGAPAAELRQALSGGGRGLGLVLDARNRPMRWVRERDLRGGDSLERAGRAVNDTVTVNSTLRDALEALLTEGSGMAPVVGARGEYVGVLGLETLMATLEQVQEQHDEPQNDQPGQAAP